MGYVELIQEDLRDSDASVEPDDLKTIAQAGHHLLHLINGVLDISKIESGQMEVYPVTVKISHLVKELTQTVHPLIRENGNVLHLEMPEDVGTLVADEVKLQQCLLNLISNAAKFTKNGQITLRLYRKTWSNGIECFYFEVEDTGIGIQKDQIKAIFKAFTQADTSTTRQYGGTGLGLAITKSFCQIMGGDVSVESEYGTGSCFTMRLPTDVEPLENPVVIKVESTISAE
jgi:signal transduction histidine kinase